MLNCFVIYLLSSNELRLVDDNYEIYTKGSTVFLIKFDKEIKNPNGSQ